MPVLSWHRLSDMSGSAVHAMIRLREAVFVVEQRCAYQEADRHDAVAHHLCAHVGGQLVGYLRVIPPAAGAAGPVIGRVLTDRDWRGQGIARVLMQTALAEATHQWPGQPVSLSAQVSVQSFYETLGFVAEGAEYLEDDIPHIAMHRAPERHTD
ncbi:GNAT family N-acetyltransferase [Salinisphaera sp. Q1T1-3]|uniref:GNAT family N-acetyltransferase n=1 Tax=Salinisphaera sp. Q1T1-3 TaxID=2321229 RepID=UPI000E72565C|nr:GNAT family N-acetyltransferase [Salinisphaera sp. Q1T1-3]RJS94905.1 GNAT family N-acetyltransferase [Salinisphaera sp. Q1T1-3]